MSPYGSIPFPGYVNKKTYRNLRCLTHSWNEWVNVCFLWIRHERQRWNMRLFLEKGLELDMKTKRKWKLRAIFATKFQENATLQVKIILTSPSSSLTGFSSAFDAPSKHFLSGPWGTMIEWRLAPPGRKADPSLASYDPWINPMNSLIQFLW